MNMRIANQPPPVFNLGTNGANPNVSLHTPKPAPALNVESTASQNKQVQDKQESQNEIVKNQIYNSSGRANRLPGTVTLFDTTA